MKILVYGINYSPELTGTGKYTGEMTAWFAEQGHAVRAITAPPYYPEWKIHKGFSAWRYRTRIEAGVRVTRCPLFVPRRPRLVSRLLHLASFSLSSAFPLLAQWRWKPDLIILVVPTLFCAPQTLLLSWLTKAKSVVHVQDFEVDAMFGLGMARGGWLKRTALAIESKVLRSFDNVSTISSGMLDRARQKGVLNERLVFFPNWADIERFTHARKSPELMRRLGVDPSRKIVLYAGNIGEKQGLEIVIDAAVHLRDKELYQFLIVGEGTGKARLIDKTKQKGLANIHFAPLLPLADLPELLASVDSHLVIQKRGAADAVLPSKLTNILAVGGNAVVTADKGTTLAALCEAHPGIAVRITPESAESLVDGIIASLAMVKPNMVASRYAREYLDKNSVLVHFLYNYRRGSRIADGYAR